MSRDISVTHAASPPRPAAEMAGDWRVEPWGPSVDLRSTLSAQLPGIDTSDPLWGICGGEAFSIEVDIGREDPVEAFTVHLRGGGDAAVAALDRLLALPGWYAFDNSAGEWVPHGADRWANWAISRSSATRSSKSPKRAVRRTPGSWHSLRCCWAAGVRASPCRR